MRRVSSADRISEDPFTRVAAGAFSAGSQSVEHTHHLVEHVVGQTERGTPVSGRRTATKRGEPADRARDVRRQALPPARWRLVAVNPTHADGPAPLVEGVEHVLLAELDAQRTSACALGVVPIERAVDTVEGDLERNALLGPAPHQLEGRAHDANQVPVVLARQVRLDGTAVLVGCHSQTTSPPTTRSVPVP